MWHGDRVAWDVIAREVLRHNPANAVTDVVERVTLSDGGTAVHKRLRAPGQSSDPRTQWAASADPRHWNYWKREAEAYRHGALQQSLSGTGLAMPTADVHLHPQAADLWLEDVVGTPGTAFTLDDHAALATALGRWQAAGPWVTPWTSRGFLRAYSADKVVPWQVLDDDAAWGRPLIRETWPAGLRDGWARLLAHREQLLDVMEHLPRTRSHLDLWVSNQIRRPDGHVVLLDWAFLGDGALGEDLGNHVPDAVFDLFWPAEALPELDHTCFEAYLAGLREAGWRADERQVRLGVVASCVKYTWLLPLVLARAGDAEHSAYHQATASGHLYSQRGLALSYLVGWCEEALRLLDPA